MQPTKSDTTESGKAGAATRRAWRPPVLTTLAIGAQTKSARENGEGTGSAGSVEASRDHPQPPAAPASKLGLALEWAFPLSARWEG
jgi:hypothetical protein